MGNRFRDFKSKNREKGSRGERPPACTDSLSGSISVAGECEEIRPLPKTPPPGRAERARRHGRERREQPTGGSRPQLVFLRGDRPGTEGFCQEDHGPA